MTFLWERGIIFRELVTHTPCVFEAQKIPCQIVLKKCLFTILLWFIISICFKSQTRISPFSGISYTISKVTANLNSYN